MVNRQKCNTCEGVLLVTWYTKRGKKKMRSVCISCGYRFFEVPSQMSLHDVNEIRVANGFKPRHKLRKVTHKE